MLYSPLGSIWRKWDLHLHSNASDGKMTPEEIINKAIEQGIDVIAITDHHTSRNVDEMIKIGKEKGIVVIPGVEFRTEYGNKSVHMIGLFPYKFNDYTLDSKGIYDEILSPLGCTENAIRNAGRKGTSKELDDEKAFSEGLCRVQVDFKTAANKIHEYGGIVTVHAGSKTNSFDDEMKHEGKQSKNVSDLYESLGTVKEDLMNGGYIDICEIRKKSDSEDFYWNTFKKVSIIASDAHKLDEIGRQFTWIKADMTIEGLKQAIFEKDRFFLGDEPDVLKRVYSNPTKYVKSLIINKNEGYSNKNEMWFDNVQIPFNSELVTIIGNKGSGKSAVADILGLLLNSNHSDDFQFLAKDRFLKKGFAENFNASLELWSEHKVSKIILSEKVKVDEPIKVKYLPQHYFETLCNEIGKVNKFREEVESVVYQYLSESDKLGKNSFKELVDFKSKSVEEEISLKKKKINDINRELIRLEDKRSPNYISSINNEIKRLNLEFEATARTKPLEVKNPNVDIEDAEEIRKKNELDGKTIKLEELESTLKLKNEELSRLKIKKQKLEQIRNEVEAKCNDFVGFKEKIVIEGKELGVDLEKIITFTVDYTTIDNEVKKIKDNITSLEILIGETKKDKYAESIVNRVNVLRKEIETIKESFDIEQKAYQKYLDQLKAWTDNRTSLIGTKDETGSLEYYKNELQYVQEKLFEEIKELRLERLKVSKEIFAKKLEIKKIYDDIKIQIDANLKELDNQSIEIVSCFRMDENFNDLFLGFINKKKASSFCGTDQSIKMLNEIIIEDSDFVTIEDVEQYLERVILYLETDFRDGIAAERNSIFIGDIINNRSEFYSYVFSLDYLLPKYEMMQNGKNLDELSPGEKGALLLVFYLALDKTEMPIIIDQPEDNLDNHSVAKILVPFIKTAKQRRQIIMVTHNPNLAIVADAEQVIYVNIDKANGNRFECITGSIENPEVNRLIVDVLEGTMPAFKTRNNKYQK